MTLGYVSKDGELVVRREDARVRGRRRRARQTGPRRWATQTTRRRSMRARSAAWQDALRSGDALHAPEDRRPATSCRSTRPRWAARTPKARAWQYDFMVPFDIDGLEAAHDAAGARSDASSSSSRASRARASRRSCRTRTTGRRTSPISSAVGSSALRRRSRARGSMAAVDDAHELRRQAPRACRATTTAAR